MDLKPNDAAVTFRARRALAKAPFRHLILGVAIANVLHLVAWAELFAAGQKQSYYLRLSRADFFAVPLTVLALGGVIGAVFAFIAQWSAPRPRIVRATTLARVVLAPFVVVTFARALFAVATLDVETRFADQAPPLSVLTTLDETAPGPKVVVLLFDAMGEAVAFEKRPAGLELPAFDRLRSESIAANHVRKAAGTTRTAVPSFLGGVPVRSAKPAGPGDLQLELATGERPLWSEIPSAFRDARELGGRAVVAGWYHPYCRVLEKDLDACAWQPTANSGGRVEEGFVASLGWSLRSANPLLVYRDRQLRAYRALLRDARQAVSFGGAGFTFVHLSAPHFPVIYDRHGEKLTLLQPNGRGHEDMLALADKTLEILRTQMEVEGTWDTSTVIVTSDHPAGVANRAERIKDKRVPFLLKLPHQNKGRVWEREVSATYLGRPLIRALLAGEVKTPEDAITWMERNAIDPSVSIGTR